ncbi:MAG: hypothetical protein IT195_11145 [Microthrixaceae bacterium]|nr:hypothetical protein [Microthrixaceae bacterium]
MRERGSVTVVALMIVGITVLMLMATVGTTVGAIRLGRIEATADLAALAAATGGYGAAASVAGANGASVTKADFDGPRVTVRVARRGGAATATAEVVLSSPTPQLATEPP